MQISELFVKLGIDGDNKFLAAIKKADGGLKNLVSSSFLVKTGIGLLGAALLRASYVAGQFGRDMTNIQTRTDMSAEALQKFAYAGELAGVKTEETIGTLENLQKAMDDFTINGEGNEMLHQVFDKVGGDINRINDKFYVFTKLQQYAVSNADKMHKRLVLRSFGLSDNMIAAMMKGAFNAKAMREANIVSEKQLQVLTKINTEWSRLKWNAKTFQAQLIATFGAESIGSISTMMSKLYDLASAFMNFIEKSKIAQGVFFVIGKIFDGWTEIFNGLSGIITTIKENGFEGVLEMGKEFFGAIKEMAKDFISMIREGIMMIPDGIMFVFQKIDDFLGSIFSKIKELGFTGIISKVHGLVTDAAKVVDDGLGFMLTGQDAATRALNNPAAPAINKSSVNNSASDNRKVTINQTNNFTNADDNPAQIAQATSRAMDESLQRETTAAMRGLIGTAGGI